MLDPIDDLGELAIIAKQPMSKEQKNNIIFIIFQNTGKLKSDLKTWNRKADADQTWANMKTNFRETHFSIGDVEDEPISKTFDQANMVRKVLEGVRTIVRDQVAEALPPQIQAQYSQMHIPQQEPPPAYQQENMIDQFPPIMYTPPPYDYANMVTPPTQIVPPQFPGAAQFYP